MSTLLHMEKRLEAGDNSQKGTQGSKGGTRGGRRLLPPPPIPVKALKAGDTPKIHPSLRASLFELVHRIRISATMFSNPTINSRT